MNPQPIFLTGAHKSGTSLLRSIFDGHSQLFAIPFETHFFQHAGFWVDYNYRSRRPEPLTTAAIIRAFKNWVHRYNVSQDPYSDANLRGRLDEALFAKKISQIEETDPPAVILEKYFEAIYLSLMGKEPSSEIRFVEKSVENAEFALELSRYFPQSKFIHILRNPYATLVAFRKFKSISYGYPLLPRIIKSLYNSYYFLHKNLRMIPNYYVVRYRDLVEEPEKEIRKMCSFLDLPWEDILLQPTLLGKPWRGNSTSDRQFSRIDASQINRWKSEIYPVEIYYVNRMFSFILEEFGFSKQSKKGSFWKPVPGENLKRFLYNRFYKYFLAWPEH